MSVNLYEHSSHCRQYSEDMGKPCMHIKAILIKLSACGASDIAYWHDERYHLTTYRKCYSAHIPALATAGKLSVDETFVPPDHQNPAGCPTKKQKEYKPHSTNVKRTCQACGEEGHFFTCCPHPDTQYRYETQKKKAVERCKKQEMTALLD